MNELKEFLNLYKGNHLSHLLFLKDKRLYWTKDNTVLISYKKIANRLIVLGNPVGKVEYMEEAIQEFEAYAKKLKCKVAYYQVSAENLSYFQGYNFFKLGEEATVDLTSFTLEGKKGAKLRYRRNKLEREGFQFEVLQPPYCKSLFNELKQVSEKWLDGKREKSFSVSFFKEDYIALSPLGILRDANGKLVAFVTLGFGYQDEKATIIDLMRYDPNSPHGTMDVMIISMLAWAKEQGYEQCSLGMCPLANVGQAKDANRYERLANLVYEHVNFHYKFKGLKEYKSKFKPTWDKRYLVYPPGDWLPSLLFKVSLLVRNGKSQHLAGADQHIPQESQVDLT